MRIVDIRKEEAKIKKGDILKTHSDMYLIVGSTETGADYIFLLNLRSNNIEAQYTDELELYNELRDLIDEIIPASQFYLLVES